MSGLTKETIHQITGIHTNKKTDGNRIFDTVSAVGGIWSFAKVVGVILTTVLTFSAAMAQEKKIRREQLPAAVEKTVAKESEGATIKGFATEVENGQRFYEASMTING